MKPPTTIGAAVHPALSTWPSFIELDENAASRVHESLQQREAERARFRRVHVEKSQSEVEASAQTQSSAEILDQLWAQSSPGDEESADPYQEMRGT